MFSPTFMLSRQRFGTSGDFGVLVILGLFQGGLAARPRPSTRAWLFHGSETVIAELFDQSRWRGAGHRSRFVS